MFLWKIADIAIILLSMASIGVGAIAVNMTTKSKEVIQNTQQGKIYDIDATVLVTRYNKNRLQLQVNWKDNLANDTSYNIIVSALNPINCKDKPCSIYGRLKSEIKEKVLIPELPVSNFDNVDSMLVDECSYMFDCNYKVTVITSNAAVSNYTEISIPNCVGDVCSCQHASSLPKVKIQANMPTNDTINFNWEIEFRAEQLENLTKQEIHDKLAALKKYKIYSRVSKETNPALSWGGALITIAENLYSLENISHISTNNTLQSELKIATKPIPPEVVLNLQTYIEDDKRCHGPTNVTRVKVPSFDEGNAKLMEKTVEMNYTWIIATISICIVASSLVFCVWKRRKQKFEAKERRRSENYISAYPPGIEMEDNINYVDKDVEEAQAKGLADIFEVPHHAIQIQEEIGEGAFGRVYKGIAINLRRMRGATIVAVKQLKKNPSVDEIGEFLSEIEMLKGVGTHHNIVCFMGCCTIRAPYLMLMEFVGRGDLLTYLRIVRQYATQVKPHNANHVDCKPNAAPKTAPVKYIELKMSTQSAQSIDSDAESERQPKPSIAETMYTIIEDEPEFEYILDHKELHNFALQIANGMRFLEEQEITHRDLAARNVLIDEQKTLKISDFGLSRHGIYTNTNTRKLPLRWLSIEAIRDNLYSSRSDVWAYGVVLWEIGTLGASPYPTISNNELIPFLLSGQRLDKPEICTQQVYDIMLSCWNEHAENRPTFEALYKALSPKTSYVDVNSLSEDYVFPPIKATDDISSPSE